MAEKEVLVKKRICDHCGVEEAHSWTACLLCGKDCCYDCREEKNLTVQYNHGVYASGSGDGYYCVSCSQRTDDALLNAYKAVDALHNEILRQAANNKVEIRRVEAAVERERERRGLK